MLNEAIDYAHANRERFVEQLKDLLRVPSVSTLPEHADDVRRAAEWLAAQMREIGLGNARVMETGGSPVVYGEWLEAPGAPTALVYGHYDVQPVDPLDEWTSPPFEPAIREGMIYARGASDDKGQLFAHLKAAEAVLASKGRLPLNLKFIFEGEEEIGSRNLDRFVLDHKDLLAADSCVVSDTHILGPDRPSIVYGLRGLVYMQVDVRGPVHDLHSGGYGGSVHNPAQVVAEIICKLHNADASVAIPGFYDDVRPLSEGERAGLAEVPYTLAEWQAETGLDKPWGEADYTLAERIGARPTCEVNGIYGGFAGEGGKTIIPASAGAKISMRLVADQDPDKIAELFTEYVLSIAPDTVRVEVTKHSTGKPALVPLDAPQMRAAAEAYRAVWGVEPVYMRMGGTIPVVAMLQDTLRMPVILMGFGLADDNIHAPDERLRLDQFYKGIDTIIHYYHNLAGC
jgi:acetylornithine deacetylase/succinyl-diaminopimelate desuccinylase-like protein